MRRNIAIHCIDQAGRMLLINIVIHIKNNKATTIIICFILRRIKLRERKSRKENKVKNMYILRYKQQEK